MKYWLTTPMNNIYPLYEMSLALHEKLVYYFLIKSVPYAYLQWTYLRLHESSKI